LFGHLSLIQFNVGIPWSNSLGLRSIQKELAEINLDPPEGCSAGPKGDNLFEWAATLVGPEGSPYAGGIFFLDIVFGDDYPYRPPKVCCFTWWMLKKISYFSMNCFLDQIPNKNLSLQYRQEGKYMLGYLKE
jgi:ubiquitin-protein ligase